MNNWPFFFGEYSKIPTKLSLNMSKSAWIYSQLLNDCSKITQKNNSIFGTVAWLQPQIMQL